MYKWLSKTAIPEGSLMESLKDSIGFNCGRDFTFDEQATTLTTVITKINSFFTIEIYENFCKTSSKVSNTSFAESEVTIFKRYSLKCGIPLK